MCISCVLSTRHFSSLGNSFNPLIKVPDQNITEIFTGMSFLTEMELYIAVLFLQVRLNYLNWKWIFFSFFRKCFYCFCHYWIQRPWKNSSRLSLKINQMVPLTMKLSVPCVIPSQVYLLLLFHVNIGDLLSFPLDLFSGWICMLPEHNCCLFFHY